MKNLIKKNRLFRRHFQLLELMVAAFILLICIVPTMRIFTAIYQSQQAVIRENQRDHLAHVVHAKFTEQLYKGENIRLGELKVETPIILSDPELAELLKKFSYQCTGTFTIKKLKKKDKQETPIAYLCQLIIHMKDLSVKSQNQKSVKKIGAQDPSVTSYDYYIYIDRRIADQQESTPGTADSKNPATS